MACCFLSREKQIGGYVRVRLDVSSCRQYSGGMRLRRCQASPTGHRRWNLTPRHHRAGTSDSFGHVSCATDRCAPGG